MKGYLDVIGNIAQLSEACANADEQIVEQMQEEIRAGLADDCSQFILVRTRGAESPRQWRTLISTPFRGRGADFRLGGPLSSNAVSLMHGGGSGTRLGVACARESMQTGSRYVADSHSETFSDIIQSPVFRALALAYPVAFSSALPEDVDFVLCADSGDSDTVAVLAELVYGGDAVLICDEGGRVSEYARRQGWEFNPILDASALNVSWKETAGNDTNLSYRWDGEFPRGVVNDIAAYDLAVRDKQAYDDLCSSLGWQPRGGDRQALDEVCQIVDALCYGYIDWNDGMQDVDEAGHVYGKLFEGGYESLVLRRDDYRIAPPLPDSSVGRVLQQARDTVIIWREVLWSMGLKICLARHELGKARELADAGDALGVRSAIEAYFEGIPRDFIIAPRR